MSLYCAAYTVSDELWVLKGSHDPRSVRLDERDRVVFTVAGVQMYFHKPVLFFSTNIHTPNPVGVIVAEKVQGTTATVELDLPAGVGLAGGQHGDKMCPSYRGVFYREEIERLADQTAKVKADFLSCDIELFGGVQTSLPRTRE